MQRPGRQRQTTFSISQVIKVRIFQVKAPFFQTLEKHLDTPALAVNVQSFFKPGIGQYQQVFFFFILLVSNQFGCKVEAEYMDFDIAVQALPAGKGQ
jgi:hypothetical protein